MKLENLRIKDVQRLADTAVEELMTPKLKKAIVAKMREIGELDEDEYFCHVTLDGEKDTIVKNDPRDVEFFIYSVDFEPNDDYCCDPGYAIYGARGNCVQGRSIGPCSFILVWEEKKARFYVSRIVFDLHPFSLTKKSISVTDLI